VVVVIVVIVVAIVSVMSVVVPSVGDDSLATSGFALGREMLLSQED
jgi:hypothetical protein